MKYMTILQKFYPSLPGASVKAPWSGLWGVFGGELKDFAANFLVPAGVAIAVVSGIVGIVMCIISKQRGGEGFGHRLAFTLGSFFVASILGAVWALFSASI